MTDRDVAPASTADTTTKGGVEIVGLDTIAESDRHGRPSGLFWPWFGANVSVLAVGYGAFILDGGVSFWQAVIVGVIGIVVSFLLCGLIALAGKRGSAPTMVLSRAIFGVRGSRLVSVVSWLLTVGWETVLIVLSVLATATVLSRLVPGLGDSVVTKIIALVVVAAIVVVAGIFGFRLIMRLQVFITVITAVVTVAYVVIVLAQHPAVINVDRIASQPAGAVPAVVGGAVLLATGFGLGWVNAAADYSRYLPRTAGSRGVVGWTTLGGSLAPVVLFVFGALLAYSSPNLHKAIDADPIGALTTILPTWFLIPFIVVALLGLIGGAVLDIYSSGLALLNAGLPVARPVAAAIDGVIMVIGSIYVVFFAGSFVGPFEGFLITLGVPIAAWAGVFLADVALRRRDYAERELYQRSGRYGDVRWGPVLIVVIATVIGWGLVTNSYAPWLGWQGYLLAPFGGKTGVWEYASIGVPVALVIGFVAYLVAGARAVRRQEASV